jgi:transcriptional regulator of nitric oxide reductase
MCLLARLCLTTVLLAAATFGPHSMATAGVLDRAALEQHFPAPYVVGERDAELPVWPIFKANGPTTDLMAYVFESVDLAPIPGFSGTPMNLLVALTPKGEFLDVRVLSQHEPVFLDGLGEAPLFKFVAQYRGLNLKQSIRIAGSSQRGAAGSGVVIDGVAKATASVRILSQSLLSASLQVARAKLGYAGGTDPALVAKVRTDMLAELDWPALESKGLVQRARISNRDVEAAFAGTSGAGLDPVAISEPDATYVEFIVALLTIPSAGRNLLDETAWRTLTNRIDAGDHVLLVLTRGRDSFINDDFVRGAVPARIALSQGQLPVEMRDLDLDTRLRIPSEFEGAPWKAFRVIAQSGLDPGKPMTLALRVSRAKGMIYPEITNRDLSMKFEVPERYLIPAPEDQKGAWTIWKSRALELGVLVSALLVLGVVLWRQTSWVTNARKLAWFRPAYLLFTLVFIGWVAQGQLSIVNVVALVQSIEEHRSLGFFLFDPMSLVLWAFVAFTLVVWGRGTFCGWLCPFGALQELVGLLARLARVPQWRLKWQTDHRLKKLKYGVLFAIVVAALISPKLSDAMVEVEPFKTAITLLFVRGWPYVLYAGGLVLLGAVLNKFFCRYLCPLGAALGALGKLRQRFRAFDWIARRAECGTPCQTCKHRCEYQAIAANGKVEYDECFQCMDCVSVFNSDELCAPRILERKGKRIIPVVPAEEART